MVKRVPVTNLRVESEGGGGEIGLNPRNNPSVDGTTFVMNVGKSGRLLLEFVVLKETSTLQRGTGKLIPC